MVAVLGDGVFDAYEVIEEKDHRIAELEQQLQWIMSQIRLAKHKQFDVKLADQSQ
jgi:hypothetical protein